MTAPDRPTAARQDSQLPRPAPQTPVVRGPALQEPVLQTVGLSKRYGDHAALDGLDLTVGPGEVVGLLGPNGAGKSTAIRLCLGLAEPSGGSVRLFGREPTAAAARSAVGYLPGELRLDERLTGQSMLELLAKLRGRPVDPARRATLAGRLGLSADDLARPIRDDSRGTKQKLGLVAAFQHDPDLLVLDEPTEGLDPLVREAVFDLLREAGRAGKAVLHSSHVLSEVDRTCTAVVMLRAGRLVAGGPVEELRRAAVRRMVVRFRGAAPVDELVAAGAELAERHGERVVLRVAGDLDALLHVLARHPVEELAFPEPDLGEAFARHYAAQPGDRSGTGRDASGDEAAAGGHSPTGGPS